MAAPTHKPHMGYVLIGHLNTGKSTATGHLLQQIGCVDQRDLERYDSEAAEMNVESQKYAWVLNKLKAERERGISIDATTVNIDTARYRCTIIDTPGHRDFVKSTIMGIVQSDVAILVVHAVQAQYQAGMARDGQAREHALLALTFGAQQLICVINMMDLVGYSELRYQEVKRDLANHVRKVGFDSDKTPFVPISGLLGENLVSHSACMPWYTGPTLLQALDLCEPPPRPTDRPLRIPLQDVHKIAGIGTVPVGRVESGVLRPGMTLTFAPSGLSAEVRTVEMHHQMVTEAGPGDNIGFSVRSLTVKDLQRGDIASDSTRDPAREAASFVAQVIIMNHPGSIAIGYTPILFVHTAHVACRWVQLIAKVDRRTGKEIEKDPPALRMGDAALVRMVPSRPLCVETYEECPALGRFAVRDMRLTVAVGIIKSVEKVNVAASAASAASAGNT